VTTLLLATFHDPEARLLPLVRRLSDPADSLAAEWRRVQENYVGAVAVWSPLSDPRSIEGLRAAGWETSPGVNAPDRGLWAAVQLGLSRPVDRIHFCDLDRLIHWLMHFPNELVSLPDRWTEHDVTMLVRSPRALNSHPDCQVLTESLANAVIARRLGQSNPDAFSGSYVWSRRAAASLVAAPGPRDLRWYTEAVMAPFRAGCTVGSVIVEGLEWETPDQYPAEIAQLGYAAWLTQFESPAQWRHRVEIARLFVDAALD
jgi:hypothetical protein